LGETLKKRRGDQRNRREGKGSKKKGNNKLTAP